MAHDLVEFGRRFGTDDASCLGSQRETLPQIELPERKRMDMRGAEVTSPSAHPFRYATSVSSSMSGIRSTSGASCLYSANFRLGCFCAKPIDFLKSLCYTVININQNGTVAP